MRGATLLLVSLFASQAICQDLIKPTYAKPEVGQSWTYDLQSKFTAIGQDASLVGKLVRTVTAVEADGTFEVETANKGVVLTFGGSDEAQEDRSKKVIMLANGLPKQRVASESQLSEAFDALGSARLPEAGAKAGDAWDLPKTESTPGTGRVVLVGQQTVLGHACYRLDVTYKPVEGEASVSGSAFLDTKLGLMVSLEVKFSSLSFGPGVLADGTASIKLTEK